MFGELFYRLRENNVPLYDELLDLYQHLQIIVSSLISLAKKLNCQYDINNYEPDIRIDTIVLGSLLHQLDSFNVTIYREMYDVYNSVVSCLESIELLSKKMLRKENGDFIRNKRVKITECVSSST